MDLGIAGRRAIIGGASKGLGFACADALAAAGVAVTICARGEAALQDAAARLAERHGVTVTPVAVDVTTPEGRAKLLESCPDPDILVTNTGGPPMGDWRSFPDQAWHDAVDSVMLTPLSLIRSVVDGMAERGFGRIVNITSSVVKAPRAELALSSAARAGLTSALVGVGRDYAARNVTVNNLMPGPFRTARLTDNMKVRAERTGTPIEQIEAGAVAATPAGRFGEPAELGAFCAFLCSAHAGFFTGQSLMLDGGAFPGML
ncbi:MAG TPA: SDR family oxidoreductase [Geminicoccus sp.]|jgi:3-oxoacyl-[acyl-carrier protein] reductase|uniref:SDR family oxidoreductase n=1 Tax=Geminicoccus sp. TaxID=2024832 RepID=UPI002E31BDC6|nr:SDR family oxidoreductase [Geminicoccus sp.]HEX2525070.1 SDR family oxidoreductase [Geminicoccus sp.]